MDDGHTSLLLGPFFYAHVVKIYSQDYLTIRRKGRYFSITTFITMITFIHIHKKIFVADRSRLLSLPEFAVYSGFTGLHRHITFNGFC